MADKVIITENLTKKFGDFTAVDGISFHVNKGEIFGFLGANGAGKTTAMKMLIGIWSLHPVKQKLRVMIFIAIWKTSKKVLGI